MKTKIVKKIDAFFLDDDNEKKQLETILNDPGCQVSKREIIKVKESTSEIDGNRRSESTSERLKYLIEYLKEEL
jgi:hypothetical protein